MNGNHPQRVEDYTAASLVLLFVNLLWIFGVIWAQFGLLAVMLCGLALNHLISRLEQARLERERRRWRA